MTVYLSEKSTHVTFCDTKSLSQTRNNSNYCRNSFRRSGAGSSMKNILRKLPGHRSRSKSKNRKTVNLDQKLEKDDKEKGFNNDTNLKTKDEHLRVPKINACDLKVQSNVRARLNENLQFTEPMNNKSFHKVSKIDNLGKLNNVYILLLHLFVVERSCSRTTMFVCYLSVTIQWNNNNERYTQLLTWLYLFSFANLIFVANFHQLF